METEYQPKGSARPRLGYAGAGGRGSVSPDVTPERLVGVKNKFVPDPPFDKIAVQFERDEQRDADIFIRWGFTKVAGSITRAYVDLEIEVDGYRFTVLHYDNSHGQPYHRHSPGFPHSGPTKTDLSAWHPSRWVSVAKDEILANWRSWVNSVVPSDVKGYVRSLRAAGQGAAPGWSEDQD